MIFVKTKTMFAYILTFSALFIALIAFTFTLRELIFKESFCSNFSSQMKIEKDEINVEVGKGKLVKSELINYGFEDEYKISVKGVEWVVVKPNKLRLENNQTGEIFTYVSPPSEVSGDFLLSIIAESFCQKKEENLLVHVTE